MDDVGENSVREEGRTLGASLAAERERQGLSRADVAHRLHMSPTQVEALEMGDYGHLPKGTFLRGFVRNYAKALGVAPEPLLEMLAGATPATPAPGIVVPTQNIRFDPLGERLSSPYFKAATLAMVAIAIAFAAMYWVMYVRPEPPALAMHAAATREPAAAPAAPAASGPAGAATSPQSGASPEPPAMPGSVPPPAAASAVVPAGSASPADSSAPAASSSSASAKPATHAKPAASAKPAAASASPEKAAAVDASARRLHFHFTGDSWVEVRDASGTVLFQKLNAAGTDARVSGRPPLQVIVGNAPQVEMTLDGKPFDLDPHTNVAVARFTLE